MRVIRINPKDKLFEDFKNLPSKIYPADSIRLRQSEGMNESFLLHIYMLYEDNELKGRLALYKNPDLEYQSKESFCIGNYECVDEKDCARRLLSAALEDAKSAGAEFVIGPMNGSTWDNYRFSAHNELPNFLLEPYHHIYYNTQWQENGFQVISKYVSNYESEVICDHPTVLQREKELLDDGLIIRNVNLDQYEEELEKLYPFVMLSFQTNFLYTPVSWEHFKEKYTEAKPIIVPENLLMAEDSEGNMVGFVFVYDDLYNRKEKSLVVKTIGRHPDKKWSGLGQVLANRAVQRAKHLGYQSLVHAFIFEKGTSVNLSSMFKGNSSKNYILYGKEI
jgi:L-amino acid N-acyltransferase YncA